MAIISLTRNIVGTPNIVSMQTNNTFSDLTTPGYLNDESIIATIDAAQNGTFQWEDTDMVHISYIGSNGFFRRNAAAACFVSITEALTPSPNSMLTTDSSGAFKWSPFQQNIMVSPTITFFIQGNLSVVYDLAEGFYWRVGETVFYKVNMVFTPTYTTASGPFYVVLPHIVSRDLGGVMTQSSEITYTDGSTFISPSPNRGANLSSIHAFGDGVGATTLTALNFPSGVSYRLGINFIYATEE